MLTSYLANKSRRVMLTLWLFKKVICTNCTNHSLTFNVEFQVSPIHSFWLFQLVNCTNCTNLSLRFKVEFQVSLIHAAC